MIVLRPCPICGSSVRYTDQTPSPRRGMPMPEDPTRYAYLMSCMRCPIRMEWSGVGSRKEVFEAMVDHWNTRKGEAGAAP